MHVGLPNVDESVDSVSCRESAKLRTNIGHGDFRLNGAVLRLMRVGRILICVHTTNKDSLLLLLLLLLSFNTVWQTDSSPTGAL